MGSPLIGLPGRRKYGRQVQGFEGPLEGLSLDLYVTDYARGVIEAGGLPVHLPVDVDADAIVDRLDGLLLTGGADIAPDRYGAERHREVSVVEGERDSLELALYEAAARRGIPVLGICRGLQLINVAHGGTLEQHVPQHSRYEQLPEVPVHRVELVEGTRGFDLYGQGIEVNSLHHQTVGDVGNGLVVSGRSDDGVVEVVESGDSVFAVQWHPEMMNTRPNDPCFTWLVQRAMVDS